MKPPGHMVKILSQSSKYSVSEKLFDLVIITIMTIQPFPQKLWN